jgi:hypothetical protein
MSAFRTLTPKQDRAVAALIAHPTFEAAAASLGTHERTVRRWLAQPAFARAYRQARRRVVEDAVARLQKASTAAVMTLALALRADRATDRIRAAVAILDRGLKGVELFDLAERVETLEAAAAVTTGAAAMTDEERARRIQELLARVQAREAARRNGHDSGRRHGTGPAS